eukprot:1673716-Pleurochrysis_carterae.AAC.1
MDAGLRVREEKNPGKEGVAERWRARESFGIASGSNCTSNCVICRRPTGVHERLDLAKLD